MDVFDDAQDHDDDPFVRNRSEPDRSALNRGIFFTSMVILLLFLAFGLYLCAWCVFSRRSRHRAAIHRLTLAALHVSDAHDTRFLAEAPSAGLDPALVASLPTFTVGKKTLHGDDGGASRVECAVCLSGLEGEEKAKLLPNCNHFFRVDCIDTWLNSNSTCPLCRAEAVPRMPQLELQDREGPVGVALDGAPAFLGESSKSNGSNSRLSSFRRILSRERSFRRIQQSSHNDNHDDGGDQDLERQ